MGRHSEFTQEKADAICERLAEGESLRSICSDEGMPSRVTVFRWLDANEDFRSQYARAKEFGIDALADEILDIADDGRNDWMERRNDSGETGGWALNGEHVQRSRVRVDSRKWLLSKLAPKKYGEKLDVTSDGKKLENSAPIFNLTLTGDQK